MQEGRMPSSLNLAGVFRDALSEHITIIRRLQSHQDEFERAAILITEALSRGNKVLWCGNGGSAADSQHLAAELVGRFRRRRSGLASIALTTDTSVLTAIANDCGYDEVFERQVEALCQPGDVVVGISTSGNSKNVCAALQKARQIGGLHGRHDGQERWPPGRARRCLPARAVHRSGAHPGGHILCGHILCEWIELATCISQAIGDGRRRRLIPELREIVALVESGWRIVRACWWSAT